MKLRKLSLKEQIAINGGGLNSPFSPLGTPMFGIMNMSSFLNQYSPSYGISSESASMAPTIVSPVISPAASIAASMSNTIMSQVKSMLSGLFG